MNVYFTVIAIFVLRLLVGLAFLTAGWPGVQKGHIKNSLGIFPIPVGYLSERLVAWVLVGIGFALIFGIATRIASILGILIMLVCIGLTIRHKSEALAYQLMMLSLFFLFIATNAGIFVGYGDILLRFPYFQQLYSTSSWFAWIL